MEEKLDIEALIKSTFKLFENVRSEQEDQEIFDEVSRRVISEGMLFFKDYKKPIPPSAIEGSSLQETFEIFLERTKEIDDGEEIFSARIRAFVNNLLALTLKSI